MCKQKPIIDYNLVDLLIINKSKIDMSQFNKLFMKPFQTFFKSLIK